MPTTVTKTLKSTGGDYASFAAWQAAQAGNITAAGTDEVHILECYVGTTTTGGWQADGSLNEQVDINGWTTDATHTVTVKAAAGEGHGGVIGGGFVLYDSSAFGTVLNNGLGDGSYLTIEDLEINNTDANGHGLSCGAGTANIAVNRCIVSGGNQVIRTIRTGATIINTLAIGTDSTAENFAIQSFQNPSILNCTSIGGNYGYRRTSGSGGPTITNSVSYGAATADFSITTTDTTVTYCASGDTSAFGTGAVTGITSADFNDYANDDYSPSSGSDLIDAGTDLSGTFTDDIAGNTRG